MNSTNVHDQQRLRLFVTQYEIHSKTIAVLKIITEHVVPTYPLSTHDISTVHTFTPSQFSPWQFRPFTIIPKTLQSYIYERLRFLKNQPCFNKKNYVHGNWQSMKFC